MFKLRALTLAFSQKKKRINDYWKMMKKLKYKDFWLTFTLRLFPFSSLINSVRIYLGEYITIIVIYKDF
jgi:hypothetical protein